MSLDPTSSLGRLVCLLLAAVMPVCCCTVQTLGEMLGSDAPTSIAERPGCCCGTASTCASDDEDEDEPAAPDGCHCVRTAPLLDAPTDQVLHALTLPAPFMVAWTSPLAEALRGGDLVATVACHGPPEDDGPPSRSARRLRRAVILQV